MIPGASCAIIMRLEHDAASPRRFRAMDSPIADLDAERDFAEGAEAFELFLEESGEGVEGIAHHCPPVATWTKLPRSLCSEGVNSVSGVNVEAGGVSSLFTLFIVFIVDTPPGAL